MKSTKSISKLKKDLDTWFSRWVRLRDSDEYGNGKCITCEATKHWKEAHAGHGISRGVLITRFDERNVHLQCAGCNAFRGGEQYLYSLEVDRRYGAGTWEELMSMRHLSTKLDRAWYIEKIDYYKTEVKKNPLFSL